MKSISLLFSALMIASLTACQSSPMIMSPMAPRAQSSQVAAQKARSTRVVYHIVPEARLNVWHVKLQNNPAPVSSFRTKEEAINAGRAIAKTHALSQIIIHKANGQIETEYTYGQDPASSAG